MANVLGILLPIRRGKGGYFNQGLDIMSQAKSNLINLILTKKGERLMQPEFGCDVHKIIFENITDDNMANINGSIRSAVKTWLPYIEVVDVTVVKDEDRNSVFATLTFSLTITPTITDTVTLQF